MEGEGLNSSQAGLVSSSQSIAHLPSQEGSNSQAIAHLPSKEGSNSPPATALLPPSEGSSFTLAIACPPPGEGSNSPVAGSSSLAIAHLPPNEGSNSTPALLASRKGGSPYQAGQSNNQNRSGRQGLRCSNRHRATQASQENSTVSWEDNTTTTPPTRPPKDLLIKIQTLSGSLTFPTNP